VLDHCQQTKNRLISYGINPLAWRLPASASLFNGATLKAATQ
jgi:hypothetical protein